ncbi:7-cyano-7-deazaguanine synthase QueC, partial [Planctomycetota bacterium]
KAVVLVSGGLDSCTTLAIAKAEGFDCFALTCLYGQRHRLEIEAAQRVTASLGVVKHQTIKIDLQAFGGSALTNTDIGVPKNRSESDMGIGIPVTYVPARNTILLSLALAWAETLEVFDLFIGVNAVDYSGYPDCRSVFIEAFESLANVATAAGAEKKGRYRVHAPIIKMTKKQVIKRGLALGVNYALTHSCYDPDDKGESCGQCDSCLIRLRGFAEAGQRDPISYRQSH